MPLQHAKAWTPTKATCHPEFLAVTKHLAPLDTYDGLSYNYDTWPLYGDVLSWLNRNAQGISP